MQYSLNTDSARRGASQGSGRVEDGLQRGKFILAEATTSSKGTQGIEFTFENEDDQVARYLTVWTHNAKGEEIFGMDKLSAIMTVLRLKTLEATQITANKYDFDSRQEVPTPVDAYTELMNKPLQILFQKELYTKGNGADGERLNMLEWFSIEEGLNATELLDGLTQGVRIETARDEEVAVKDSREARDGLAVPAANGSAGGAPAQADFDDDIPF